MNLAFETIPTDRFAKPNLAGLMALFESNYARWRTLLPAGYSAIEMTSYADGDLPLHLRVLEKTPYTELLQLTYYFPQGEVRQADPDVYMRVYRDLRQAEVVSYWRDNQRIDVNNLQAQWQSALRRRWEANMLLNKWLRYCLDRGHRFGVHEAMMSPLALS